MIRSTGFWQSIGSLAIAVGLFLGSAVRAEDNKPEGGEKPAPKKDGEKEKETPKVIVIQLDASKVPPDLLKQLMALGKTPVKEGDKKPQPKKEGDKPKEGEKKPNIVQVDLNKLSPELAKRLMAELAGKKTEGGEKPAPKKPEGEKPAPKKPDGEKPAPKKPEGEKG